MARQYSAKTFLRNTPNKMLKQYFTERNIVFWFEWWQLHETFDVNHIFAAIEKLDESVRSSIDRDFRMVNELACADGVQAIIREAAGWGRDCAERFAKMRNHYARAMWAFLEDPQLFSRAGTFHDMDRRSGWRRRFVGCNLDVRTDEHALAIFAKKLQLFYRRQGRGRFCHVDVYLRHDPERHCFFVYPEDYASTELGFDDRGHFHHRTRRPAFELIFVYRPEEGMLELAARGRKEQIEQLQRTFGTTILGLADLPGNAERPPFDLNVLKDGSFPFPTDPADGVVDVEVRLLRLELPSDEERVDLGRIVISAPPVTRARDVVYRLLHEAVNRDKVDLDVVRVSQAKLRFLFAPDDGARPRTLTFEVTCPDHCTLKEDPHDQIARKYLRARGIARG